jgi:cbb3-type cytochrome oxidase maturation protein
MNITFILIPLALILGIVFLAFFIWATIRGQFDDLASPPQKILFDDDPIPNASLKEKK